MIKCETCGLWHGNSHQAHTQTPVLGPLSDRSLPDFWSWIYFHGKAEEYNMEYQDRLLKEGLIENWEAPDLVRASVPVEAVADDRFKRVKHVGGLEMVAVLWSADVEYRQDYETGVLGFHARRRGLICCYDDEEALDYAHEAALKRRDHL